MHKWPYDLVFEQPTPGLHKQELITYKHDERGNLIKETATRNFYGDSDYIDSVNTDVICSCK